MFPDLPDIYEVTALVVSFLRTSYVPENYRACKGEQLLSFEEINRFNTLISLIRDKGTEVSK